MAFWNEDRAYYSGFDHLYFDWQETKECYERAANPELSKTRRVLIVSESVLKETISITTYPIVVIGRMTGLSAFFGPAIAPIDDIIPKL